MIHAKKLSNQIIKSVTAVGLAATFLLSTSNAALGYSSIDAVQNLTSPVHVAVRTQTLAVDNSAVSTPVTRDTYSVTDPPPPPPPPPVIPALAKAKASIPNFTPDPGSAQAYAQNAVSAKGWSSDEFNCLVLLWNKESGWKANANNSSSGAYGIPQALPGTKMASAGADWATNANTQINWGLGYISTRYTTPCNAWQHSVSIGWY